MEISWKVNGRKIISAKVTDILKEIVASIWHLLVSFAFHKKGKLSFIDGDIYEGGWKDGLMQGRGNLIADYLILEFFEFSRLFISLEKASIILVMEMCMKGISLKGKKTAKVLKNKQIGF